MGRVTRTARWEFLPFSLLAVYKSWICGARLQAPTETSNAFFSGSCPWHFGSSYHLLLWGGWVEKYPLLQCLMSCWLQAQSHRLAREPTGCFQNKSRQHNPHTLARKQAKFLGPLMTTPTRTFQQLLPTTAGSILQIKTGAVSQWKCLQKAAETHAVKGVFCSSANV